MAIVLALRRRFHGIFDAALLTPFPSVPRSSLEVWTVAVAGLATD